jgi:hypothetical protein
MRVRRLLQTIPLAFVLVVSMQVSTAPAGRQAAATAKTIAVTAPERVGFYVAAGGPVVSR